MFHVHLRSFLLLTLAREGKTNCTENKMAPLSGLRLWSAAGFCVYNDFTGPFYVQGVLGSPPMCD